MAGKLPGSAEQVIEGRQYVTFYLNNEEYAFDALTVQEIIELSPVTKVPHLPAFFKGVINLRGFIIPVIELKQKFGMQPEKDYKHTCVIVTEFSRGVMGLIVDAVSDVLRIPEESVTPLPPFGTGMDVSFIRGMGKIDGRLVLILDIDKVIAEEPSTISGIAKEVAFDSQPLSQTPG
ncbi:MAG: chemotaxis protein CheW [Thermodesulfovibrionales bacterium]|jgi:purine-binding chemotaxis protein CheW